MKRILISQSIYIDPTRNEFGDKIDCKVIRFVQAAEYLPIVLSNYNVALGNYGWDTSVLDKFLNQVHADGILLTGGPEVGVHKNRDVTEKAVLSWAIKKRLPVLGLCRGMQLMGKLEGANLEEVPNHIREYHQLTGILSNTVNSYHKFAFRKLPSCFKILAKSSDGIIEAVQHKKNRWEGWMWHPEREENFRSYDLKRFQRVFG